MNDHTREDAATEDSWEAAAHALAKSEVDLGECIFGAILELENGDHAGTSFDFERGLAYATGLMRVRLHEHYESRESEETVSPYSVGDSGRMGTQDGGKK